MAVAHRVCLDFRDGSLPEVQFISPRSQKFCQGVLLRFKKRKNAAQLLQQRLPSRIGLASFQPHVGGSPRYPRQAIAPKKPACSKN